MGFFEYYVYIRKKSVFGYIGQYFAAVEINERGTLYLYGLIWYKGNLDLILSIVEVSAIVVDGVTVAIMYWD